MAAKNKRNGGFWRGFFLLLLGMTMGMAAAAVVTVYTNKLHLPFIESPTRSAGSSGKANEEKAQREFLEFHDDLRGNQPVPAQFEETSPVQPVVESRVFVHYLQVGAFRNDGTAEELRAQLALNGLQVTIKSGDAGGGNIVYRVWVGPYSSEDEAEKARAELALSGYNNVTPLRTAQ